MKVVIDTNIVFSSFLLPDSKELKIIQAGQHNFFLVDYSTIELFKHKEKIMKYSKLTEDEILETYQILIHYTKIINENDIPKVIRKKAFELCHDIDIKDVVFIACTLFLDAYLWTGDKELIEKLPARNFKKIVTTSDLV